MAPRGSGKLDVRGITIPLTVAWFIAVGLIGGTVTMVTIYWGIANRLDNLVTAVNQLSTTAVTQADLENFCLRSQAANKGWNCPFGQAEASAGTRVLAQRRSSSTAVPE